MTRLSQVLVICSLIVMPTQAATDAIVGQAKIVDGDSLEIREHRIRLWGVDAPEFKQICIRGKKRWGCGLAATAALRKHLDGASIHCVKVDVDNYGRLVAKCSADKRSINEWLVREGWAADYSRYSKGAYAKAEAQARAARRGIWSGDFESPEHYRHRPH